ncbi:MAG: (2Fe-2S)-binding protein [Acidobacteriota bacterium]
MHLHEEKRVYTGAADELVCECLSVERSEIEATIEATAAITIGQVRRECAAGGGCGCCHEEIARLILGHCFSETLDFTDTHNEVERDVGELVAIPPMLIETRLINEIEDLLSQFINPKLAVLGVVAGIIEVGEEVVLELAGADEELKYTLSFWLDAEFARHWGESITVIIA